MLNQVVLVGRLVEKPELEEDEKGNKRCNIIIAVPRSYKNENGEYETDMIDILLTSHIAQQTCEWCNKGDLIGIRGRLEMHEDKLFAMADKITFLSSKKSEE